jgi:hypothetical protein
VHECTLTPKGRIARPAVSFTTACRAGRDRHESRSFRPPRVIRHSLYEIILRHPGG